MDKFVHDQGHGNIKSVKSTVRNALTIGLIGTALLLGAGCSGAEPGEANTYGHDGYMGYSNSNPNLMNRNTTLLYQKDIRLIEQILEPVAGIKSTRVSFNGSELHVSIKGDPDLTDAQLVRLRARAQSIVQQNMPRYEVHVKTSR
ncbi:hypothetical protein ACX1C1_09235 [Paenibacillus sp. strain BS8-2]